MLNCLLLLFSTRAKESLGYHWSHPSVPACSGLQSQPHLRSQRVRLRRVRAQYIVKEKNLPRARQSLSRLLCYLQLNVIICILLHTLADSIINQFMVDRLYEGRFTPFPLTIYMIGYKIRSW